MTAKRLLGILLILTPVSAMAMDEETLRKEWQWIREDVKEWKLEKGKLSLRTQPGRIWAGEGAKNILARRDHIGTKASCEATVRLVDPIIKWEQAGLLLHVDDDNFVKLVVEHIDGKFFVVMASELKGKKRQVLAKVPIEGPVSRLRIEVDVKTVTGSWKTVEGKSDWTEAAVTMIPSDRLQRFAIFTQDGPADKVRWAEVSDVQVR